MKIEETQRSLAPLEMHPVSEVFGIVFRNPDGWVRMGTGQLEFKTEGGGVVRLLDRPGCDELEVKTDAWTSHGISREDAELYGEWIRVPLMDWLGWRQISGETASSISLLRNRFGEVCGSKLRFESATVVFVVAGDESYFGCSLNVDVVLGEWQIEEVKPNP